MTHILFVVQVCQAIDAHMVKQDLSAGEVAPDTQGETETQSTDAAAPDSSKPKKQKNEWDGIGHAEGPVVTSYDRPDLKHGEAVHRDIDSCEWEKVLLKKRKAQEANPDGKIDPKLKFLFQMMDENKSGTVDIPELIAKAPELRATLKISHPQNMSDIRKVSAGNCSDCMACLVA